MGGGFLSRLVVVSNRVAPAKQPREGNQGGLAVAVLAALRDTGGIWFGWNGKIKRNPESKPELVEGGRVTYRTISLTREDYEQYYMGYANRALWPLFHYRLDLSEATHRDFEGYLRVNRQFVTRLLPMLRDDDLIWIHDFHLIPMAEYLRNAGSRHRIGFFLHIPWPAVQVLLALPHHRQLVRALCSYDVVGFQTETDKTAFCDYIREEVNGECGENGVVRAFGRTLVARAFPISIDTENVTALAKAAVKAGPTQMLKQSVGDRNLVIGVDRLDYSKGLLHRLEAVEHLLESYPEHRRHFVMLQIAPPTRSDVPEYQELQHELEAVVGHINGRFAEADWAPARYLNKGYNRRTLCGFFRISRVGLVTPLRDGMNLVAKEYVAAQDPKDPGVLVLSRFAGAAQELTGALIVNPYDPESVGEALQEALAMPLEARKKRWRADYEYLVKNDISAWREDFLSTLSRAPFHPAPRSAGIGVGTARGRAVEQTA
jgi:trehalose 6-phosphate synthase